MKEQHALINALLGAPANGDSHGPGQGLYAPGAALLGAPPNACAHGPGQGLAPPSPGGSKQIMSRAKQVLDPGQQHMSLFKNLVNAKALWKEYKEGFNGKQGLESLEAQGKRWRAYRGGWAENQLLYGAVQQKMDEGMSTGRRSRCASDRTQ